MTDETKLIKGSGGPPPPPPTPYRAPDTLHSRSFATIQDLISEGEIEGFASASKEGRIKGTAAYNTASLKDVFLNDTPILNSNADSASPSDIDFNFRDVTFKPKFGEGNQTPMSGIPNINESRSPIEVAPSTDVQNTTGNDAGGIAGSVNKQISNPNVDAVVVTLRWPSIQIFEEDGDIRGDTVEYKIQVRHDSGSYVDKVGGSAGKVEVTGRTADSYSRDHRIELTPGYTTVDVRVIRVTKDSPNPAERQNAFQFISIQEVIYNNSTYNNSAYVGLRLDSKQFNRIPTRKYRIRGVKVKIPGLGAGGGTEEERTPTVDPATGRIRYPDNYIFNGNMGQAVYTNCPAMCLLDLLTNKRYGLGDHVSESNLDLFSFVAASKYANELVDDGTNSNTKEARFSCNVNIQSPKEAFEAINELSGVMRCMPIWSAGSITIAQDKPTVESYLFNLANVGPEGFNYQGSSLKQRHSVVSVSYFNMDSREVDFEVVEDAATISKLGTIVKQVKAFACTSRNQAARLGRAILFAEQNESETITFTTSIDAGVVVRPGSVIAINDPVRAGARRGGRIISANTTEVTIDALEQTGLPSENDNPTISVILPDGTVEIGFISDLSNAPLITVDRVQKVNDQGETVEQSAFSSAPLPNSPYLLSSTRLQTQLFRVIQVEEQDDINYVITALSYVPGKYDFIENGTALPTRTVSLLNEPASPPSALTITEKTVVINSIARSKLIIDWQPQVGVTQYLVNYKLENGNYTSQIVFSSDFEILDTVKGRYTVQVFSYNARGEISTNFTEDSFVAEGKTGNPENVQDLTIEPLNEQFVRLRFRQAVAIDVLHGGRVYVRHTNQTGNNATFQAAQDVIEAAAGNVTEVIAPALAGTYLLKFQDDGGRFSPAATSVALSLVDIFDSVIVKEDREDTDSPPFNNTTNSLFTHTQYDATKGGLTLTNVVTNPTGTYNFPTTLDLGGVFSVVLKRHFRGEGFYISDLFDNRTELINTWTDFDGATANEANARISVRTSTDMSSYSDFNDFANGTFKGRGFQFKVTLTTTDVAQNMNLQQLGYTASMPSRTEQSAVIFSDSAGDGTGSAGAKIVTFTHPFFVGTSALGNLNNFLPSVNISPQDMATGDYFELSNISGTSFTVHFKNSSNASIIRKFTYSAVGFGKGG